MKNIKPKKGVIKKAVIKLILGVCLTFSVLLDAMCVSVAEKPKLSLYSLSCALIDGDSGRVLYEKNGNEKKPMASTTKIMTLIIALENGAEDDVATVSEYAASMPKVKLGMVMGERYRVNDLFYSLMLESHNDTAVAIAEQVGGNVENFAAMMNAKAEQLNLESTYFITPNGLDAYDEKGTHSTTAIELARLLKYCVYDSPKRDKFVQITSTKAYTFTDYEGKRQFTVYNKNAFLDMMDGVVMGKTGFTADAGYCYCCVLERDGKKYILALLGCGWPNNKTYKWSDAKTLFNYGIDNYQYYDVNFDKLNCVVNVEQGVDCKSIKLVCHDKKKLLLAKDDKLEYRLDIPEVIKAPVSNNTRAGTVYLYVNGELISGHSLFPEKTVKRYDYSYCLRRIKRIIYCINY